MSTLSQIVISQNKNPGIVPPWLREPKEPIHTWAELEAMLNQHGFSESRSNEVPTHNESENNK